MGNELYYLPDFLLHDVLTRSDNIPIDLWVEVKGQMTEQDAEKIIKFANVQWHEDTYGVEVDNPIISFFLPLLLVIFNLPTTP